MRYVQLRLRNDWGTDYYEHPDFPQEGSGCANQRNGVKFKPGQEIEVQWPDGTHSTETVVFKNESTTVGDHGHTYPVSYQLAHFTKPAYGRLVWFRLDEVLVKLPDPA